MNYQTTVQGWHDFYSITGEGAASLIGCSSSDSHCISAWCSRTLMSGRWRG
jgi:hypothetical protein